MQKRLGLSQQIQLRNISNDDSALIDKAKGRCPANRSAASFLTKRLLSKSTNKHKKLHKELLNMLVLLETRPKK